MTDEDRLLATLEQLGITKESYRVLALLPLVLVAWADGKVQPKEMSKLLEIARRRDFLAPAATELFEGWLRQRPTPEYVRTALGALVELARRRRGVGADIRPRDLRALTELSHDIAASAGGLWGDVLSVTPAEEEIIASLVESLHIDDGRSWAEMLSELE